jgi:uncharacterized pyridoxal phosphate-containing UPF0001 family protein
MVELISALGAQDVRANLALVRERIRVAGRDPDAVQVLAAVKYLRPELLEPLAAGGITLVGENRAQELVAKAQTDVGRTLTWDFIGALQSRKVPLILPHVRYIHSVATDSALAQLARHGDAGTRILVEVNVARDPGKAGVLPEELSGFLERSPVPVVGLMTMPPLTSDAEANRRHFAALRELARGHGLTELSMGTSQDYEVAVQEGATIVRLGSLLFKPSLQQTM